MAANNAPPTAEICQTLACTPATKVPNAKSVIIARVVALTFKTPCTPALDSK